MRKLAIDYGKKRIGLSISDSGAKIALPLDTLLSKGMHEDVDFIKSLVLEKDVDTLILGLPLNMDGSEGKRVALTKKFGSVLKRATGLRIEYFDERLSSVEATDILYSLNKKPSIKKGDVDKLAAMLILQAYLDQISRR